MSGWSAQQAQWLRALGYPVLVRREPDWPQGEARAGGALPPERTGVPPQRSGSDGAPPPPAEPRARETTARPPRRDAPPRPDTGPTAVPPAAGDTPASAAPRADTSAKLVAIAQARRERDFGNPRFALLIGQLLRAAGLEGDAGRERLRTMEVDLSRLHRDPAAKRALWPALRALRRESRQ